MYAVFGYIFVNIGCLLYNFIAARVGGIEVETRDVDTFVALWILPSIPSLRNEAAWAELALDQKLSPSHAAVAMFARADVGVRAPSLPGPCTSDS